MSRALRMGLFFGGMGALAVMLVIAVVGLPDFGHYPGPYGIIISHTELGARRATSLVAAVNFDYRAFDTLGEEFILFAAVLAVALILRDGREENERANLQPADEHLFPGSSSALGVIGVLLVGPLFVFGSYVIVTGALTPGGGFQGGVIVAAAALIAFLAGEYVVLKRVAPHVLIEVGDAVGAAGFALIGLGGLIFAGVFFQNFIALGTIGSLLSAGTIPLSNLAVGVEVAGAFLVLWSEFSDQALVVQDK